MNGFIVILDIIFFLISIATFCLIFFIKDSLGSFDSSYLISLGNNWVRSPFTELSSGPCLNNTYTNLNYGFWGGSVQGCYCSSSGSLNKNPCPSKSPCRTISANPQVRYNFWKKTQLCGLMNDTSYLSLQITNTTCPQNTKNCGIVDSFNNSLCIPVANKCPINSLAVVPQNYNVQGMNFINLTDGKKLVYGNNGKKVFIEFSVSENSFCSDNSFVNKASISYTLETTSSKDKCWNNVIGPLMDNIRYTYLDTDTIGNLYSNNSVINYINNLPGYPLQNLNFPIRLYFRGYIGINLACFNKIQSQSNNVLITNGLSNISNNLSNNLSLYNSLYTYYIIIWCITTFFYFIYRGFIYCLNSDLPPCFVFKLILIEIVTFLLYLAAMIISFIHLSNMFNIQKDFSFFKPYINCGNPIFVSKLENFSSTIDSAVSLSTAFSALICIVFLIPLISFIFNFLCECCDCYDDCCKPSPIKIEQKPNVLFNLAANNNQNLDMNYNNIINPEPNNNPISYQPYSQVINNNNMNIEMNQYPPRNEENQNKSNSDLRHNPIDNNVNRIVLDHKPSELYCDPAPVTKLEQNDLPSEDEIHVQNNINNIPEQTSGINQRPPNSQLNSNLAQNVNFTNAHANNLDSKNNANPGFNSN